MPLLFRRCCRALFCLLLSVVFFFPAAAPAADAPFRESEVLVLNAYHAQYNWTDRMVSSITSKFSGILPRENINIEYMDSRKREDKQYYERLFQLYRLKYQDAEDRVDVIISTDDNAFQFIQQYRDSLFPDIPVVFSGVNFYDPAAAAKDAPRYYTGVIESDAIRQNLDLIQTLHPDTRRIVILADQSRIGRSLSRVTRRVIESRRGKGPKLELWNDYALETMFEKLGNLSKGTVVFLNAIQFGSRGQYFSYTDDLPRLSRICPVPIYGQWGVTLGNGVVGGFLNDAARHGGNAAKLAIRILKGEKPSEIPVRKAQYAPAFDYRQLQRFGIKKSRLPENSHIINEPVSFYKMHHGVIWAIGAVIAGLFGFVVVLLINVRRRKASETALRTSEEKYKRFFEEDLTGDFLADAHGRLTDCNPAFARMLGFRSIIEPLGYSFREMLEKPADYETIMDLLAGQDNIYGYELSLIGKNGRPVSVIANIGASRDADGGIVEIKGYLFDLTHHKQLEVQLRQSQKMEALGRLAGGVAHDFNNLITAVIGYSEMALLKLPDDNPSKQYFEIIYDAGSKASALTAQLLAFSRKQEMELAPVHAGELVENMAKIIQSLISDDVALDLRIDWNSRDINADAGQIEQVLLNLALNAKEAMPEGGTLVIEAREVNLDESYADIHEDVVPGPYILLRVSDTGIGMNRDIREQAFEPFFTTKQSGTGLGLATIHGIVKQHRGHIFIYSTAGQGTTISIYFPVVDQSDPKLAGRAGKSHDKLAGGTESVIVADDDDAVRQLVYDTLAPLGYTVWTAENAQQALDLVENHGHHVDLLITDVVMPGLNGNELARRFIQKSPQTQVLFMSGYTDTRVDQQTEFDCTFLSKPIVPSKLTVKLREILDR
ncbi:MAG: ATP-binding protein [Thermodesulfobacteriota bacterium]